MSLKAWPKVNEKDKRYLKTFLDFLNPFNPDATMKPLIKYLLNIQKRKEMTLPIYGNLEQLDKPSRTFKVDAVEFMNMVFTCITSDNT